MATFEMSTKEILLLKPVQRIPQYRLLLQDYLRHLREDSEDYCDTVHALEIVSEVAEHANNTMKISDNFAKLLSIQNSIIGGHEIIKPSRMFIKEGELMKLSRKGMQPRYFILVTIFANFSLRKFKMCFPFVFHLLFLVLNCIIF